MSAYDDDNDNDDDDVDDVDEDEVWERPRLQFKWWSGWLIIKFTNICFRWIDEYMYWYDLNEMTIMTWFMWLTWRIRTKTNFPLKVIWREGGGWYVLPTDYIGLDHNNHWSLQ